MQPERAELALPPCDALIAALAARQYGVVTRAQLRELGLSDAAVGRRAAAGRLHRVHRGVYAVGHARLSDEGEWMAAVLAGGLGAALSHQAASRLFRIWRRVPVLIDVVARRRRRPSGRVRFHRAASLDARDVTTHRGIPVTTVARTLVDLSDQLTNHQLANVIHEAAFRNRFSEAATRAAMERAQGRHNLHRLEQALIAHAQGSAGTRSDLEDRALAQLERRGAPEPQVNTRVAGIEVDLYWPDQDLVVEVDGPGHRRPRTIMEDAGRDARLRAAGVRVRRKRAG